MKSANAKREYRQSARAEAAEATARRIGEAFARRLETSWFDEIRLEDVAADAGVSVPTIVRRFGGKEGLLEATYKGLGDEIEDVRKVAPGDVEAAVRAVAADYERTGDLVIRTLAQEDRYGAFRFATDLGRKSHRQWVAQAFAPQLERASDAEATLDRLVIATDVYVWKLMRRDMGRPLSTYKKTVVRLIAEALQGTEL